MPLDPEPLPPVDEASLQASLTRQQRNILEAISFFIQKGELPTVREVGALVGLRSPATVLKHLRALERRKIISITGKSRGIRILDAASSVQESGQESVQGSEVALPPNAHRIHFAPLSPRRIPLVGAIAAGRPFESYSDAFVPDGFGEGGFGPSEEGFYRDSNPSSMTAEPPAIPIDPSMFVESGEVIALRIEGDSMIQAGILDGDYALIRRQSTVEDGEIAAVIINGEGTLKRWRAHQAPEAKGGKKTVTLLPANERFDPIEISEDEAKDVLVFGKYVGLVRGNLRIL